MSSFRKFSISVFMLALLLVLTISGCTSSGTSHETEDPEPEKQFTITATAGDHGTIDPSGTIQVREGESITFTITPDQHYLLNGIQVDGQTVENTETYTFSAISDDHSISASFGPGTWFVTVPIEEDFNFSLIADNNILETADRAFILGIVGQSHSDAPFPPEILTLLMNVSFFGELKWTHRLDDHQVTQIYPDDMNTFKTLGMYRYWPEAANYDEWTKDLVIHKWDGEGNILETTQNETSPWIEASCTADDGITGVASNTIYLLDMKGDVIWSQTLNFPLPELPANFTIEEQSVTCIGITPIPGIGYGLEFEYDAIVDSEETPTLLSKYYCVAIVNHQADLLSARYFYKGRHERSDEFAVYKQNGDFATLPDGGYVIYFDTTLKCFTNANDLYWELEPSCSHAYHHVALLANDSGIVMTEYRTELAVDQIFLEKYALDGQLLWQRTYHIPKKPFPAEISQASDQGMLIRGEYRYQDGSEQGIRSIFLLKVDSEGHSPLTDLEMAND